MKGKREGSTLVSVLIGVLFLSAIGLIILTAANQYMISVNADHISSNNFYGAEAVLEEVKTGLLEYAGDAAEEAYRDVLQNYSQDKDSKRKVFSQKYFSLLADRLRQDSAGAFEWADDKLGRAQTADIEKLKVLSHVPEAVTVVQDTNLAFVIREDEKTGEYTFVIRNLLINYTNESGYRSSIRTDICLSVPDYSLEGNSTFDEMKDYISISDDTLAVAEAQTGNTIQGNVYTGNSGPGILLSQGSGAEFKSPVIVSRGDLEIRKGADASLAGENGEAGELYLQNIHLASAADPESSLETRLTLLENSYIANDLNIETNHATVTLGGKYYGYSYNENNDIASSAASSRFSSAILINGMDTTLQTDRLSSLVLAGRAFVSRQKKDDTKTVSDIMMGESIAVKSNQLAYLVPDEYIVLADSPGDHHNPVSRSEVEGGKVTIDVDGLKDKFGEYLDQDEPYEENYNNTIGYVFYYLKFKDDASANRYFAEYYNGSSLDEDGGTVSHKDELQSKGRVYISDKDLDIKFDQTLYLVAGNVLNNYYNANGASLQQATYFGNGQTPSADLLNDGRRMGQNYVGRQLGLTPSKNTTGAMRLPTDAEPLVSSDIVDFDNEAFQEKITENITTWDESDTGVEGAVLCISKGDYSVTSNMKGLLIANGDVTVSSDFTGLILATGKVTVENRNLTLKSDMVTVGKLFDYIRTDEALSSLFRALNGTLEKRPDNLEECVSYQNWVKNDY